MSTGGSRASQKHRHAGALLDNAPKVLVDQIGRFEDGQNIGHQGFADDFLTFESTAWSVIGASVSAIPVTSPTAAAHLGVLNLIAPASDEATATLAYVGAPFKYTKGKGLWFVARVRVDDVDTADLFLGLGTPGDTDPTAAGTPPVDGIFFEKADTATKMDFHVRAAGTSTEKTAIDPDDLEDGEFREYGFRVDEDGNVRVYVDGKEIAEAGIGADDDNLPSLILQPYLAIRSEGAAVSTLGIDYVLVAQDR